MPQSVAHQATLAIQLTHLAEQSRQAAIFEERNRIACEIHDTLAQTFTGVAMQLQAATCFLNTKPNQAQACITRAQQLAQAGLAEARRSVWALQPEATEYSDLSTTLKRIAEQLTAQTPVQVKVYVEGTPRPLPPGDIIKITGDMLNLGRRPMDGGDMCTDDRRPTVLNPTGVRKVA